jgi:PAS domain S-box-containing protein
VLEALRRVASTAGHSADLDAVFRSARDELCRTLAVDSVGITILDARRENLTLEFTDGASRGFTEKIKVLPLHASPMAKRCLETGAPCAQSAGSYPDPQRRKLLASEGFREMAMAPLRSRGRTLGMLGVGRRRGEAFLPKELDFLAAMGSVVGAALENATQALRRQEQAEALLLAKEKRAESALAVKERRLRTIIDAEPECVKVLDARGRLLEINTAGLAMLEADDPAQVLGKPMLPFVAAEHQRAFRRAAARAFRGQTGRVEFRMTGLKGARRWMESHLAPLRDEEHRVVGVLGIARDCTERRRAEEELRHSREELRALAARLVSIREEERTRIAREIHDELGQALTALKMDVAWVQGLLRRDRARASRREAAERLAGMSAMVERTIGAVRKLARELRPSVLDDLGLAAAVEWESQQFQARTGIECSLKSALRARRLPREVSTAVFRIFQETLTNVARHSQARRVDVRLLKDGSDLLLEVRDDGRGLPEGAVRNPRSLGLVGMRERALLLGGEVSIEAARGRGTTVRVRVPVGARRRSPP